MNDIITTNQLTKHYGKVHAVDGISVSVRKGEIYGFLGLNGSGKTTTIRMLLGMIRPTSGASFIYGKQVHAGNHDLWRNIGYLVETPYSYPELTVRENLELVRRLRRLTDRSVVEQVIQRLHLASYSSQKAKNLSLGNAQRLGLAKALLHQPEILILDEPTNGLDPAGILEIRELLQELSLNKGVTIFISSHILGEISKLATRIGIIHEGHLIQEVDADQLNSLRHKRLIINALDKDVVSSKLIEAGYSVCLSNEGFLETTDEQAILYPQNIATILVHSGCPPTLLSVVEEDLETYFLRTIDRIGGYQK